MHEAGIGAYGSIHSFLSRHDVRFWIIHHIIEMNIDDRFSGTTNLQVVVNNAPLIIWSIDAHGIVTTSEGRGLKEVGLASGQMVGQSIFELYKDNAPALAQVQRALRGETLAEEIEITGRIYETHYAPLKDADGRVTGVVGISSDITARWEAEQMQSYLLKLSDVLRPLNDPREIKIRAMETLGTYLKVSRCYYAEVTDDGEHCVIDNSFHSGIGSIDGRYRLVDFGRKLVQMLREGQVIMTCNVAEDNLVTASEREMNLQMQIHSYINIPLVKQGQLICLLGVNQSAPRQWKELHVRLVQETAERTWAAVARARAELRIQQSEQYFKGIIEAIPQLVWVSDASGEATYFNHQWYAYTGATPEQSLGNKWTAFLHPDDVETAISHWKQGKEQSTPLLMEFRLRDAAGEYRWMLSRAVPILDADGNVERWFGTCTDIHDRKSFAEELERKVHERTIALDEANRLLQRSNEELRQFAYVSSHDLQEPLRKIRTFSSMALERLTEKQSVELYLSKINASAARMSALINDILQFSQANDNAGDVEEVDLNELIAQVKIDFELLVHQKRAQVEYDRLPSIRASRLQLTQLFSNLMSNALKFSGDNAKIAVRYRQVPGHEIEALAGAHPDRSYHCLQFSDNGIGFNPDYAEQIFKLFTRLHNPSEYKGTGIGLALCKKIIENHEGVIHATSEHGKGSTFHIYLPVSA